MMVIIKGKQKNQGHWKVDIVYWQRQHHSSGSITYWKDVIIDRSIQLLYPL